MRLGLFFRKGFGVHVLLLIIASAELAAARWSYRNDAEIDRLLESGSSPEKAYALHVLANRGRPRFHKDQVPAMLMHDDPLVREMMMTSNMMRYRKEPIRRMAMRRWPDQAARTRAAFLLEFRIGNFESMTLSDLRIFLEAGPADE